MPEQLEFRFDAPAPGSFDKEAARRERKRAANVAWRKANPLKAREYTRRWTEKNPDKAKAAQKAYYHKNAGKRTQAVNAWRKANPEKVRETSKLSKRRQYYRRRSDPAYKLRKLMNSRLWSALQWQGQKKQGRTLSLIGCTAAFLIKHLEEQFGKGMSWTNYGIRWHVDHRIPCAQFDLSDPNQQKLAFHFSNLQPMWGFENIAKGAKVLEEHQFPLLLE